MFKRALETKFTIELAGKTGENFRRIHDLWRAIDKHGRDISSLFDVRANHTEQEYRLEVTCSDYHERSVATVLDAAIEAVENGWTWEGE